MVVHYNTDHLPAFTNAVVTIGTFDGVHTGHRQIIELMKNEAKRIGGETVIVTFHPHPRKVVSSSSKPGNISPVSLLNTMDEKISILDKMGIGHLVIVPFTEAFASQTAEEYIENFLIKNFHPHTIIIGHDHRFGKGRVGNFQLMLDKAAQYNYEVKEIPAFMLDKMTISSTKIREAITNSDIETANHFLDYKYSFTGLVIEGNKLGRTIGYPTANLAINEEHKLIPGNGVYAVEVKVNDETEVYKGMMNIGVRPTVDGTRRTIEVNIFDFDRTIYGDSLTVTISRHLRSEVKFNGLDELKAQLAKDKENASILNHLS